IIREHNCRLQLCHPCQQLMPDEHIGPHWQMMAMPLKHRHGYHAHSLTALNGNQELIAGQLFPSHRCLALSRIHTLVFLSLCSAIIVAQPASRYPSMAAETHISILLTHRGLYATVVPVFSDHP